MENCIEYEEIYYCRVNGAFSVGTGSSSAKNAVVKSPLKSHILIPKAVKENEVKEIAVNAFFECSELSEVTIEARIVKINHHAFCRCCSLTKINIPNTCESIDAWGIQTYNISSNDATNPFKSLNVYFEPNSKLKAIEQIGIALRENVNLYFCEKVNVEINKDAFQSVTNLKVYSPFSFTFNGIRTITKNYSSLCYVPKTCFRQTKKYLHLSMCFSILFS